MDILKRELAPIVSGVWEEIDKRAGEVLKSYLSARKVVNVQGPKGWNYTAIPEGRLEIKDDKSDVKMGLYKVKPLAEIRIDFELDRWELDNFIRGAKDIDFTELEEAAEKVALFEENAIFNGLEAAGIEGMVNAAAGNAVEFSGSEEGIMEAISKAIVMMQDCYAEKPYTLVVGEKVWNLINSKVEGYPLAKRIEQLIGGDIVFSHVVEDAILLPYDSENLEMTIGRDFSIGYCEHDTKKVKLFIGESFTFRVLDPRVIVNFKLV